MTKASAKRALKNGSAATWKDEKDGKTKRMDKTKADRMHGEYLTLPDMRKARHLSQVRLAEATGAHQATVVKCERQSDHLPSTLTSYVRAMGGRAMGGEIKLMVEFPATAPVVLEGLGRDGGAASGSSCYPPGSNPIHGKSPGPSA